MDTRLAALIGAQPHLSTAQDELTALTTLVSSISDQSNSQFAQFHDLSISTSSALSALVELSTALGTQGTKSGAFASPPPAVTAEILRAWQAEDLRSTDAPSTFAFVAAAVNKHWRSVALSTSCIWTRVVLNFTSAGSKRLHDHFKLVLRRSKTCPLHLQILNAPPAAYRETIPSELLLQLLTSSAHIGLRFRHAARYAINFDESILALLQADLPLLESIEIQAPYPHNPIPSGTYILTSAPRLRHLGAGHLPLTAFDLNTLRGLTEFSSKRGLSDADCVELSSKWSGLTSLSLVATSKHTEKKLLALPALTSLRCSGPALIRSFQFEDHFSRLRTLDIPFVPAVLSVLSSLLFTSLQELTLRESSYGGGRSPSAQTLFLSLTDAIPNLRIVRLHTFVLFQTTLPVLFDAWDSDFFPTLEKLVFERCTLDVTLANSVIRFLQRRRGLDVAVLSGANPTSERFPPWLETRLRQLAGRLTADSAPPDEPPLVLM
ncbi:hypothetical protein EXIGLDRAFT_700977 [Exidia glandulosa HHB12029]|uniref:F-box domain-containing protein n=1 Tax=Exidia glandulosa HHB12029 TaxID=1314781 RepID=A0A166B710_EXIGL|nr:hypothetical protein EXIGLDRAFT_700977 [Exidia glandulosa HHB12029]